MQHFQFYSSTIAILTLASSWAGGLSTASADTIIEALPEVIKQSEIDSLEIAAKAILNSCSEKEIAGILNCELSAIQTEWLVSFNGIYSPVSGVLMEYNTDKKQVIMKPSNAAKSLLIGSNLGYHPIGIVATDIYGNQEQAKTGYLVVTAKSPKPVIRTSCIGNDITLHFQSAISQPHYYIYYENSNAPVPSGRWNEFDLSYQGDSILMGSAKDGLWYKARISSSSGDPSSDFTDPVQDFCPIRFNDEYYLANNPDVAMAIKQGLISTGWQHYQANGKNEGRSFAMPSGYETYNELYYLANNPDVAIAVEQGLLGSGWLHFLAYAQAEGRSAQIPDDYNDFSEKYYLENNPDVAVAVRKGLLGTGWQHYQANGRNEGRSFVRPLFYDNFNEEYYLANNPDVAMAVEQGALGSGWQHYDAIGRSEGRSYNYPYNF